MAQYAQPIIYNISHMYNIAQSEPRRLHSVKNIFYIIQYLYLYLYIYIYTY